MNRFKLKYLKMFIFWEMHSEISKNNLFVMICIDTYFS